MSGGSFNYLFSQLENDPLDASRPDMEKMIDFLRRHDADDVADDLLALKAKLDDAEREIAQRGKEISDVLHAAEWWVSCDYTEDQFRTALNGYRFSRPQP